MRSKTHKRVQSKPIPKTINGIVAACFILVFAALGTYLLTSSHAASPFVTEEAEAGSLGGSATSFSDASASAGAAVKFGVSGGGSCTTTLTGSQTITLQNDTYHLQSNEWGSSAPFSICNDGGLDFSISSSSINQSLSGAPGAYPSLTYGCHWTTTFCTANSGLPVLASTLSTTPNKVTTSYNTTVVTGGDWDDSYDNWYNPNSSTTNNSSGLEMMIWLDHLGTIQPAGSTVARGVSIGGRTYDVWHGGSSPGGTVSYVMNPTTTSVTNLDLGPLTADSVARGYMTNSWYLIDVEAGFEPWISGQGLTANSFNVTVH